MRKKYTGPPGNIKNPWAKSAAEIAREALKEERTSVLVPNLTIVARSATGYKVQGGDEDEAVWLDIKHIINIDTNADNLGLHDFTIPEWLAKAKGLVD